MFPLRDDIPARHFPIVNSWLIIVNLLCFGYEFRLGAELPFVLQRHGFVAARFFAEDSFNLFRYLPVLSSMFLHASVLHVVSNMWMLYIFGDNVEDRLGHGRYLLLYLLCGAAAVAAQAAIYPTARMPMIGASGAISGVLGAYLFSFPRARVLTFVPIFILFYLIEIPAYVFLLLWFVMQFFQGATHLLRFGELAQGGVAWWAHVGGFVAGGLLLPVLLLSKKTARRPRR